MSADRNDDLPGANKPEEPFKFFNGVKSFSVPKLVGSWLTDGGLLALLDLADMLDIDISFVDFKSNHELDTLESLHSWFKIVLEGKDRLTVSRKIGLRDEGGRDSKGKKAFTKKTATETLTNHLICLIAMTVIDKNALKLEHCLIDFP